MPYQYRGDYYRGARGDLLGGLMGAVGGFLGGGGIVGGILGGLKGLQGTPKPGGSNLPAPTVPPTISLPGGVGVNPGAILPGGKPFLTSSQGAVPAGYHLNKGWLHSGKPDIPPGTIVVRNRSMNPGNARALRRGIRREHAFVALARRTLKGTGITIGRRSFGAKKGRKR